MKKNLKILLIFDVENWLWHFLKNHRYVNSENTIISFEYIDFLPKISLILYPSLENTTTHTTIILTNQSKYLAEKSP